MSLTIKTIQDFEKEVLNGNIREVIKLIEAPEIRIPLRYRYDKLLDHLRLTTMSRAEVIEATAEIIKDTTNAFIVQLDKQ